MPSIWKWNSGSRRTVEGSPTQRHEVDLEPLRVPACRAASRRGSPSSASLPGARRRRCRPGRSRRSRAIACRRRARSRRSASRTSSKLHRRPQPEELRVGDRRAGGPRSPTGRTPHERSREPEDLAGVRSMRSPSTSTQPSQRTELGEAGVVEHRPASRLGGGSAAPRSGRAADEGQVGPQPVLRASTTRRSACSGSSTSTRDRADLIGVAHGRSGARRRTRAR